MMWAWGQIVGTGLLTLALAQFLVPRLAPPADVDPGTYRQIHGWPMSLQCCGLSMVVLALATYVLPGSSWLLLPLASIGIVAAAVDRRTMLLPRHLTDLLGLGTVVVVAVMAWLRQDLRLAAWALGGTALVAGGLWVCWRLGQMGFGDVRLGASIGATTAVLGASFFITALFLCSLTSALWGIWATRGPSRKGEPFPYGPGLVMGPFLALGARLLGWS